MSDLGGTNKSLMKIARPVRGGLSAVMGDGLNSEPRHHFALMGEMVRGVPQ